MPITTTSLRSSNASSVSVSSVAPSQKFAPAQRSECSASPISMLRCCEVPFPRSCRPATCGGAGGAPRHKSGIAALLRLGQDGWTAEDWHVHFDERAEIASTMLVVSCRDARSMVAVVALGVGREAFPVIVAVRHHLSSNPCIQSAYPCNVFTSTNRSACAEKPAAGLQ
jgi:hypothetical protein